MKNKVVFILGPTAVGKSALGIEIAKNFNGEIISADSVQVFKGLNIGSAKITAKQMQNVPHYGIDLVDADKEFSTFDFVEFTKKKIQEICDKKCLPIVVGGTGLYIKSLVRGYDFGGVEKDDAKRSELEALAAEKGLQALVQRLKQSDLAAAEKIDKNNKVRLIRAIEIAESSGTKGTCNVQMQALVVGLTRPREQLYEDINKRVDQMMQDGLLQEVAALKNAGLNETHQSMHAIGYKELLAYLNGQCTLQQATELIKQHSRNYAKRQLTFLRGMQEVKFVDVQNFKAACVEACDLVQKFLND